jgi:AcrR family transcriptional regulator
VGVAQGTFYYHFRSKDELIEALAAHIATPLSQAVGAIAADESTPIPARIQRIVETLTQAMAASRAQLSGLLREGNEGFHDRVGAALRSSLHPPLLALVRRGNAEGSVDAEPAPEVVELVLAAVSHLTRSHAEGLPSDRLARMTDALQLLVTRALRLHSNS